MWPEADVKHVMAMAIKQLRWISCLMCLCLVRYVAGSAITARRLRCVTREIYRRCSRHDHKPGCRVLCRYPRHIKETSGAFQDIGLRYIKLRTTFEHTFRRREPARKTRYRAFKTRHRTYYVHTWWTNNRAAFRRYKSAAWSIKPPGRKREHRSRYRA